MPLIGYLIIFNAALIGYLELSSELTGTPINSIAARTATTFRLICIYFGLTFLGVGAVLFAVLCPERIKLYESAQVFVRADLDMLTDRMLMQLDGERAISGNWSGRTVREAVRIVEQMEMLRSIINGEDSLNIEKISRREAMSRLEDLRAERQMYAINLLYDLYFATARSKKGQASCVIGCFTLGIVFLSIPGIWMFGLVLERFWKIIYSALT